MKVLLEQNNLLLLFAFAAGLVSVIELLEYLFTKNIPWLARLVRGYWRSLRRTFSKREGEGVERQLVLNFSGHPVLPCQKQEIDRHMHWTSSDVINVALGNVPEDQNFADFITKAVERAGLLPEEWQATPLVVIPAGYSPIWSVVLAELHGRLGYFPDVVRLRSASKPSAEQFEVAEIMNLREVRHQSRSKRC